MRYIVTFREKGGYIWMLGAKLVAKKSSSDCDNS